MKRFIMVFLAVIAMPFITRASNLRAPEMVWLLTERPVTIYCLDRNSLKLKEILTLPPQTTLEIMTPAKSSVYEMEDGSRETRGFYSGISISILEFPESCMAEEGWIAPISDIDAGPYRGIMDAIRQEGPADSRYLEYYHDSGRPRASRMRSFINKIVKRFSISWNKRIEFKAINDHPEAAFHTMSANELKKWRAIQREMMAFADRTRAFDLKYTYIGNSVRADDLKEANSWSIRIEENYGVSPLFGAWDVAVLGTARRKKFEPTPCAEFASEVIRQAYKRAGYEFADDFKPGMHTRLAVIFHKSTWGPQSVRGLGDRLAKAGWIPWDPTRYRPVTGAIGMHGEATTPGHAYIIGGSDGSIIVDNGHPLGLDLRTTSTKHKTNFIPRQYSHSVFWLPPGILPEAWPNADESLVIVNPPRGFL